METNSRTRTDDAPSQNQPIRGEIVYIYAYDIAYDIKREPVEMILSQPTKGYFVEPSKRIPKQIFFYRPSMAEFPPQHRKLGNGKTVELRISIKLFGVGAMSIQVRMPFEVERLEELVEYHDLKFENGRLQDEIEALAQNVLKDISQYCIRPVPAPAQSDAYTVFCLAGLPGDNAGAEQWLKTNRKRVSALLMQEENAETLSEQEARESTELYLSYYGDDLVVVDWDSALVVGAEGSLDDILYIMELANVQLVELAAYDKILDEAMQFAYRDVNRQKMRSTRRVLRNLREIRIDLARLSDELSNITKFFGDWYLAKIHKNISDRFHLADWQRIIGEKMRTLDGLYQILSQDRFNMLMFVLEATIVLLFIIDLIVLLMQS